MWAAAVLRSDLAPARKNVAMALSLHMKQDSLEAWPSMGTLAAESGVWPSTVQLAIKALVEKGLLEVSGGKRYQEPNGSWRQEHNVYRGLIPEDAEGASTRPKGRVPKSRPGTEDRIPKPGTEIIGKELKGNGGSPKGDPLKTLLHTEDEIAAGPFEPSGLERKNTGGNEAAPGTATTESMYAPLPTETDAAEPALDYLTVKHWCDELIERARRLPAVMQDELRNSWPTAVFSLHRTERHNAETLSALDALVSGLEARTGRPKGDCEVNPSTQIRPGGTDRTGVAPPVSLADHDTGNGDVTDHMLPIDSRTLDDAQLQALMGEEAGGEPRGVLLIDDWDEAQRVKRLALNVGYRYPELKEWQLIWGDCLTPPPRALNVDDLDDTALHALLCALFADEMPENPAVLVIRDKDELWRLHSAVLAAGGDIEYGEASSERLRLVAVHYLGEVMALVL
jgi:hypothetical protein